MEIPSDIAGLVYIDISRGVASAADELRRELEEWL
jgi:predicted nucleotide-binding protein